MTKPIKILVVEDEMIIGAKLALQLDSLGFEVTAIVPRGEEVLLRIQENKPDLVLMDIQLKGEIDGIDTAHMLQEKYNIPIIYLTANTDESSFEKAKATNPYAFLSKPFKKRDLQRAIELTINRVQAINLQIANEVPRFILSDSIFVKHHDKMVKVVIKDILYIEAERNYCRIYSKNKEHLMVMTLKELDSKLPDAHFMRIHRSFIVNIAHIVEVAGSHVVIEKKAIPISKKLRMELLSRLQTI